jgi:hypothetical protein
VPRMRKIHIFARSEASIGRKTLENELSQRDNVAHEPPWLSKGCNPTTVTRAKRVSRKRAILARRPGLLHESGGTIEFFVIPACPLACQEESYDLGERGANASVVYEIAYSAHDPVAAGRSPFPLEKLISTRTLRVAYRLDRVSRIGGIIRVPVIARGRHV